jgi:hypothetical protein
MPPRGLKAFLKKSSPAKLVGVGKFKGFVPLRQGKKTGRKLRGLTKRLEKRVWSSGVLPLIARTSKGRAGGHWKGKHGGRMRGSKVDAQLTKLINGGPSMLKKQLHVYKLTKMVLSGLHERGLEPVMAQRCVISEKSRLGTAADFVCYSKAENQVVLVELKCGFDSGRTAAAVKQGKACKMIGPLSGASDCNVHRHLAQLAVTHHLFCSEQDTLDKLADLGLKKEVKGLLLYANDEGVEFFDLTDWWEKRAGKVLECL